MNDKDRVQYAHSVETGNIDFASAFTVYFDQLMGIYSVVRPCNYIVTVVDIAANCFSVNIKFEDEESCNHATEVLRGLREFDIYGKRFSVNNLMPTNVSQNEIRLDLLF